MFPSQWSAGLRAAARAAFLRVFLLLAFCGVNLDRCRSRSCLSQASQNQLGDQVDAHLGGTFRQCAGCHSFCDEDSRDAGSVTAQLKAYKDQILPNCCWSDVSSHHTGLAEATSPLCRVEALNIASEYYVSVVFFP